MNNGTLTPKIPKKLLLTKQYFPSKGFENLRMYEKKLINRQKNDQKNDFKL